MQSYGNPSPRNVAQAADIKSKVPVPAGKTGPVGGEGSDNPVKPCGHGGAKTGFTGGIKPGKV